MIVKLLEVRDKATFIPVFALKTTGDSAEQRYLLARVGFTEGDAVILGRLSGETSSSADPFFWRDRTMTYAHEYITKHFDKLRDGDVVDVEYVLGETLAPKVSERVTCPL